MANLPLAFAELLAGGTLLAAGLSGNSIQDVFAGAVSMKSFDAGGAGGGAATAGVTTPQAPAGSTATFDGKPVAGWIAPILEYARAHGWKGTVSSGWRSYAEQLRIWNSGVRPAAKPGTSNHEFTAFPGGAVDVTDAAQLSSILKSSPYAGQLVWAGAKDPVHFSHPHGGGY